MRENVAEGGLRGTPRWKKVLIGIAILLVVIGAGLQATTLLAGDADVGEGGSVDLVPSASFSGDSSARDRATTSFAGNNLLPTSPRVTQTGSGGRADRI